MLMYQPGALIDDYTRIVGGHYVHGMNSINWCANNSDLTIDSAWRFVLRFIQSVRLPRLPSNPSARDKRIVRMREKGMTYREIGEKFGISVGRVRQIIDPHQRNIQRVAEVQRIHAEVHQKLQEQR